MDDEEELREKLVELKREHRDLDDIIVSQISSIRVVVDGVERFGWRADIFGRFQLDPFRERRWAPYGAAGVSVRGVGNDSEEYLMVLFGLEGPLARGWSPALEVGFGGGFRAGLVMRRGSPGYR